MEENQEVSIEKTCLNLDEVKKYIDPTIGWEIRRERYRLQGVSKRYLKPRPGQRKYRVCGCLQYLRSKEDVCVHLDSVHRKAFFSGLQVCCSVWVCPICSSKVTERRRLEILTAQNQHFQCGGVTYMVTLTIRHKKWQTLQVNMEKFRQSLIKLRSGKRYQTLTDELKLKGIIRSIEITHGQNGWHPHSHELWMLDAKLTAKQYDAWFSELFTLWKNASKKVGLELPTRKHGLNIKYSLSVSEYLTKIGHDQHWGSSSELTKSMVKKGHGSLTPFDFLRDENPENEQLFIQYAEATFGWRQIFWSPGLKKQFNLIEKTDDEIASEVEETAVVVARIPYKVWKQLILNDPDGILRSNILTVAECGEDVLVYLVNLGFT